MRVVTGLLLVVVMALCSGTAWAAGDSSAGEKLFNSVGCTGCHGAGGGMPAAGTGAPKLAENPDVAAIGEENLAQTIGNGFPAAGGKIAMPSFKNTLKPDQLRDLAAYVHGVSYVDPNLQPHVLWAVLIALFVVFTIGTIALLEYVTPEAQYRRRG
ncbi:MAG: c-type cytochrome [bacterium]|nr:c-type cytochrome [bacterium]